MPRPTEANTRHDRYANLEVDDPRQRMEDCAGAAILATNRNRNFDRAAQGRLRFVVDFPCPDAGVRGGLWRARLHGLAQATVRLPADQ